MPDLTRLPHGLDRKTGMCQAIIETPRGRRTKFNYDPKTRAFIVKALMPEGLSFPLDFGFIPSTLAEDGDPIDVMVLIDEPSFVGAVMDVRLIGAMEAEETEHGKTERNDRLLAVAHCSHAYADIKTPDDLPTTFIRDLTEFWVNKHRLEGKRFKVLAISDGPAAMELVRKGSRQAKKAA
ncbi:MAG TPA: inorganic diphosphatase [Caulobacteraceae bacterium]|jgi:inorganic pyrophosphatase|nr:inorganic diphosphatase [Caulobacteraceae bacterium]